MTKEQRFVYLQHLVPKHALTAFARWVAGGRWGVITTKIIRRFVAKYGVNMSEAVQPDITAYATFNDFFTRTLKPSARPLSDADVVCPVDGAISQFGVIDGDQIFQAKGHHYTTQALVGGDAALAAQFQNGAFATLYLSPKDYHRIHMPCAGTLLRMIYVPGALYSVNPATARGVPGLFARNERVVCVSQGVSGPFVMVLVGAAIVGSMATAWHGVVNPPRTSSVRQWRYDLPEQTPIALAKGAEMGQFLLGSTVVLLFQEHSLRFNPDWRAEGTVRMGETMGWHERRWRKRQLPPMSAAGI